MRRYIILFAIIHIIVILSGQNVLANNKWFQDIGFHSYNNFDLTDFKLSLSEKEREIFSIEAQNELLNLTALYGNSAKDSTDSLLSEGLFTEEEALTKEKEEETAHESLTFHPTPELVVSADFNQSEEDSTLEKSTNISMEYQMNSRTQLRAEFGLERKEWWDIEDIELDGEQQDDGSGSTTGGGFLDDRTQDHPEAVFNTEKNDKSRLGLSIQTSDRVTITADYVDDKNDDELDYSTIFGVEYNDDRGQLRYIYQIDYGDEKTRISGVELGLKGLATFNASYKLLNPDVLKDQLRESIWDFGIDVDLNEISSLSLGYQLKSNEDLTDESDTEEKESNIRAQLEFRF